MKTLFKLCLCMFAGLTCSCGSAEDDDAFVRVENGRFVLDGKPCYFLGTNFWYGPILGSKGPGGDRGSSIRWPPAA